MRRLIIHTLRMRQWVKNGVVFAPLIFSGRLQDPLAVWQACLAAACFCVASSGIYVVNDILDRRIDRFHPTKKRRPIASGKLPVRIATALAACLVAVAICASFSIQAAFGVTVALYLGLNALYALFLKRIVIVDAVALSLGFVVRVWGGAVVIGVVPSHWLQLTMFFLALFLSLAKRRQELAILHANALRHRGVLADYSPAFIDQLIGILTAVAILCYALYSVSPDVTARLGQFGFIYTVPFVVYGVFRYLYLIHIRKQALDPTEALLSDGPLLANAMGWGAAVVWLLYR